MNAVYKVLLTVLAMVAGILGMVEGYAETSQKPKVYFTKNITPENMQKLYRLVNQDITGRVAVKVHTGEPNAPNILSRDLVKAITDIVPDGKIVERMFII